MTRALPRAHIHNSRLLRFLNENAMIDAVPTSEDVGQQLGDWLDFRHAIALHAVLNPDTPIQTTGPSRTPALTPDALRQHVTKVRSALEQSILQGAPHGSGLTRIDMPPAELNEPIEPKIAFEPYRRFQAAHQRQMESVVRTLRSQVRAQLAKSTPALQQLATLDATFENILSEREAVLLGKVSRLLEKRFAQALKQHLKAQADLATDRASHEAMPAAVKPLAWLMPIRQAMRTALLAELDARLQPTLGLVEAFHAHHAQEQ
jgi:hypothetical protein